MSASLYVLFEYRSECPPIKNTRHRRRVPPRREHRRRQHQRRELVRRCKKRRERRRSASPILSLTRQPRAPRTSTALVVFQVSPAGACYTRGWYRSSLWCAWIQLPSWSALRSYEKFGKFGISDSSLHLLNQRDKSSVPIVCLPSFIQIETEQQHIQSKHDSTRRPLSEVNAHVAPAAELVKVLKRTLVHLKDERLTHLPISFFLRCQTTFKKH